MQESGEETEREEGNIKTDLKDIGLDGVDWINVAQNEEIYRAPVNTLINHQRRVFRSQASNNQPVEEEPAPWSHLTYTYN